MTLPTPSSITTTLRGVIPRLLRDNVCRTSGVRWINVLFETLMSERCRPQQRRLEGKYFLSGSPHQPGAHTTQACQLRTLRHPSPTPPTVHNSQKRLSKGMGRTAAWLGVMLRPPNDIGGLLIDIKFLPSSRSPSPAQVCGSPIMFERWPTSLVTKHLYSYYHDSVEIKYDVSGPP